MSGAPTVSAPPAAHPSSNVQTLPATASTSTAAGSAPPSSSNPPALTTANPGPPSASASPPAKSWWKPLYKHVTSNRIGVVLCLVALLVSVLGLYLAFKGIDIAKASLLEGRKQMVITLWEDCRDRAVSGSRLEKLMAGSRLMLEAKDLHKDNLCQQYLNVSLGSVVKRQALELWTSPRAAKVRLMLRGALSYAGMSRSIENRPFLDNGSSASASYAEAFYAGGISCTEAFGTMLKRGDFGDWTSTGVLKLNLGLAVLIIWVPYWVTYVGFMLGAYALLPLGVYDVDYKILRSRTRDNSMGTYADEHAMTRRIRIVWIAWPLFPQSTKEHRPLSTKYKRRIPGVFLRRVIILETAKMEEMTLSAHLLRFYVTSLTALLTRRLSMSLSEYAVGH
ncbi:uncharacterized protein LTR77_008024 [Saxophila tyrrhenica]|uniref:Uncharacterized protein n=1 Tax=Saxophila tyrrhenica TaxID=1690608 RepID=A0AAV9P4F3_9PEZI|nr:hypothetical protein LTR77_008024 [Saxophila tyrrhenica]